MYLGEDMVGDDGYGTWSVKRLDAEYIKKKSQIKKLKLMVNALRISDEYDCVDPESENFVEEMREFEGCSGTDMWSRLVSYIESI